MSEVHVEVKCVNAHDRCFEGGPCPLCEVVRYRDEQGRFVKPRGRPSLNEALAAALHVKEPTHD